MNYITETVDSVELWCLVSQCKCCIAAAVNFVGMF